MNHPKLAYRTGPWGVVPGLDRLLTGSRGKRAADFHDACQIVLERDGWSVNREYRIEMGPYGLDYGFIDLVAFKTFDGDEARAIMEECRWLQRSPKAWLGLALELDNRSARRKSLEKLLACPLAWIKGVLLRNPK